MSMGAWYDRDVPAAVQLQAGVLTRSARECAKAVHLDPSRQRAWSALLEVAGAGGAAAVPLGA